LSKISEAQYREARAAYDDVMAQVAKDPASASRVAFMARDWHSGVVQRYEQLQKDPGATHPVEIHVARLGDLVVCSNPFELCCEYGIRKNDNRHPDRFPLGGPLPDRSVLTTPSAESLALSGGHTVVTPRPDLVDPLPTPRGVPCPSVV